jgi:hypothetical protein
MTQGVSCFRLTAEDLVRSQASPCDICGGQNGGQSRITTDFPLSTSVSPISTIRPVLHTNLHLHFNLTRRTKARSLETLQNLCSLWNRGGFFVFKGLI